ncbi:hypothetical protein [Corynebacterium sp. HS2168-gen11]|nr:hypothetical protein [Corynebacterium sp. HS2168-gen11]MCS4536336.1 hypothetical protein [Corynebacterium sp. HS2168-gen11]
MMRRAQQALRRSGSAGLQQRQHPGGVRCLGLGETSGSIRER